ncbi:MAG: site-specific DNA-methyltransferase [Ellagibacter isourolithinifaciens]|uniref:site-specific DNA-methyltransferase n=1 Tax=Ellagibacter isourolithinifaciens TaxID=2137581 RepID=UPI002E75ABB0|nr:site-specific DNA-methyltransferase [Ellagibacter isourolithinifaciens]MEE1453723.1 site-specific DNA-methyltransferase [Ellagibacter isourolithinifaciens]
MISAAALKNQSRRFFLFSDETQAEYNADSGSFDEEGGRLVQNLESNGRFHSDWCSMIYSRLLLARDLLSKDGALFISIDDNEETNLMKICSEIFGAGNFVAKLSVQVNPRGRNLDRYIAKTIEPVLVWVKDYQNTSCLNLIPKDERMLSEYNRKDQKGSYRPIGLRNRNQNFNPTTRPNLYFSLWIDPETGKVSTVKSESYCVERLPLAGDGSPTCWTWSKDKIDNENDYLFAEETSDGWRVYRKDYLDEGTAAYTMAKSLQIDGEFNNDYGKKRIKELFGSNVMSFPKSPFLMERIVEIGSNQDSLILDFFSGSATLADAVLTSNSKDNGKRRFIMIQWPEEIEEGSPAADLGMRTICDIGEERIRRVGKMIVSELEEANGQLKLGEEPKPIPDIGYRVLKIDSSSFKNHYASPEDTDQSNLLDMIDNVKEGRTPEDLLFQVLPAFRIPYCAKIDKLDIEGKKVFGVKRNAEDIDYALVACFDIDVNEKVIEEIARMKPSYAVMRDLSFKDDSTASNFEELFKTFSPDTIRRVV